MKKLIALISVLLLQSGNIMKAGEPVTYPLWNNDAPTSNGISADKEENDNPDWITFVSQPTMTVYPADKPNGMALLMCPGGGYFGVSFKHEGSDMAKDLNDAGITLAVLKYRVPNGHNEIPSDDARKALDILKAHASEYGIDPKKIGVGGASAGAHLAATVANHPGDVNPAFQVMVYPVVTMEEGVTHQGSRDLLLGKNPSQEMVDWYSNEKQVSANTAPVFIAVSQNDDIVPLKNSIDYFQALVSNNVPVSFHVYPDGGHGWLYRPEFKWHDQFVAELLKWMQDLNSK